MKICLQSNDSIMDPTTEMKLLPVIGTFLKLNEFCIYLFIFHDLYNHNKYLAINSVISSDVFNNRQKHNSLTLSCQVGCFIVEGLFTFHLLVANVLGPKFSSKEISFSLRVPQFAIQTLLQISTSKEIRENLFFARFYRNFN